MATAYEIPGQRITINSSADYAKYTPVVVNTNGDLAAAGADAVIAGVIQREVKQGEPASLMINGVTMGYLGGTVATGAKVSINAANKFVTASTGPVVGICLIGGGSGDLTSILLK